MELLTAAATLNGYLAEMAKRPSRRRLGRDWVVENVRMRFLETTDGTLIAGDMIKSVHWTDVDDCRRIVTKDDNAYTVSNFRWALFQNDELPVIPAQPGWFLVGVWHEAASVGDHTLVPIVGWRIDGTMATPIATEPVESDYAMLAPNGTVYGAHEVYWSDIDEFMREKLGKPEAAE